LHLFVFTQLSHMQKHPKLAAHALVLAALLSPPLAQAQLGGLLQKLQQAQQGAQPAGPGAATSTAKGGKAQRSDQLCSRQVGTLGRMKVDTGVIASEFRIADLEGLQDDFHKALAKGPISKTFPNARFFQASFETARVRALYDTFLAFPEPNTLAALIQISRGTDAQEQNDARMALVYLHLQAPELSAAPDRWQEHFKAATSQEHYTATVFRARIAAYGEYGPKNLRQALGDLVAADRIQQGYRTSEPKREFDSHNYQLVHTATARDIYLNEPNMPSRQRWQAVAEMAAQIEQAQRAYASQLPNTRIGRLYAEATRVNHESIEIGNEIIRRTQSGNQTVGQIASLQSLRESGAGEKKVFEDISPEVQSAQLRVIGKLGSLDEQQKQMLAQAQEKRMVAQGIIAQSYGELIQSLAANMGGDLVRMAAPLPALTQANNALIQSCLISAKWEQAMRAKDVPKPDAKATEASVANLAAKYKD